MKKFKIVNKGKSAEIWIYEDIGDDWFGGLSAKQFSEDMKAIKDVSEITVYINSAGGSVFEGVSIYNQLKRHKATITVEIDGLAASIASLIAMAGDTINMAENAMMMIHRPYGGGFGNADDLRSVADTLDKIQDTLRDTYAARSGMEAAQVAELIEAETWMSAAEALEYGLVDSVTASKKMAAYVDLKKHRFKNMPEPEQLPDSIYTVKPEHKHRSKYADVVRLQTQKIANLGV